MLRIAIFKQGPGSQRGGVLLVMLVILVIGAAALLVSALNSSSLKIARDKTTADALAQAKDALIGYAVTYADTHNGKATGYLPCPDPNGIISGPNGEGSSETCNSQNVSAIGRLPWKTLDLPPLRDGNGECLWYAVAGSYENNPMTYNMMNWDNNGLFQVLATPGVMLAGQTPDSNAVAVVFAPGATLGSQGQNHSPNGSAPICGGNYNPGNYLDHDSSLPANNATPSTTANTVSQFFTAGATANINDQIIYITRSDIFNAIKKRNDFSGLINTMLNAVAACLSSNKPDPIMLNYTYAPPTQSGYLSTAGYINKIGRVPLSCLAAPSNNWQDNLLYGKCSSGNCLTINGNNCDGILIFSGERGISQLRNSATDRNTWSNYLEGSTLTQFSSGGASGGTAFTGASSYNPASTSTDILACVP